jgi:hypothetical protein
MSLVPFDTLPDEARLWCFGASRALDAAEVESVRHDMERFVEEWTAHRRDLRAGFALTHDRFLLVAVDESLTGASGCSIDALMSQLRALGTRLDTDFLDSLPVWFRAADGSVGMVSRAEFAEDARAGSVSGETLVFDLTAGRLADVRQGRFEAPAGVTWHRSLLKTG